MRHGNAALGVADFVVHASANELDIVGRDPQGAMHTHLHLRTGMVTPEDWDTPTGGRELSFEAMGEVYPPFASAGLAPLALPLTADPYLNTFVLDPFVAGILSRWGIEFADHARVEQPETGYAQCGFSVTMYYPPCSGAGPLSTCLDYWGVWSGNTIMAQKVVCNDAQHSRAERRCAAAGLSTPCGTAGPNGCATCGPAGIGGGAACLSDVCSFVSTGPGNCTSQCQEGLCYSDDDCCACGGYCGPSGVCVY